MQSMSRRERRRREREIGRAIQAEERSMMYAQTRILAMVRRALEQEFGFGNRRLQRFANRLYIISGETKGGNTLEGVSFDEFMEGAEQAREIYEKERQGEPGALPGRTDKGEQRPIQEHQGGENREDADRMDTDAGPGKRRNPRRKGRGPE